jgi:polysaccharide export outer membrane protein
MKVKFYFPILMAVLLLFCGCKTPNVAYFSDMKDGQTGQVVHDLAIRLQPEDKVSIIVKSKDPQLSDLFNLPVISGRIGYSHTSTTGNYNYTGQMSLYTIDEKGEIDFPVIGKLKIGGMRREEAADHIKQQLIAKNMVQDPVVTIEYGNLGFNVLGEVNRPGRYNFELDHLTILDAISLAGDLTIQGKRENVTVIRVADNGERISYRLDLRSARQLYASPAFYIHQNDVIYVEPNNFRARQTTVNGNNVLSAPFWISVASFLTSVAVLIFK